MPEGTMRLELMGIKARLADPNFKADECLYDLLVDKGVSWPEYAEQPDLVQAGINDAQKGIEHFLGPGHKEGRVNWSFALANPQVSLPADWDWQKYVAAHKDLRDASLDTQEEAEWHYLNYGYAEPGRWPVKQIVLPTDWDWQKYVAAHKDLRDAGIDTQEEAEWHYLNYGYAEPGRWPVPPPPSQDIKSWQRLPECDNPISPYFSLDWPRFGTYGYQGGDHSSEVYRYPHDKIMSFQAESVISMLDGLILLERGGPQYRGQIYYNGQLVYSHPRWTLMLEVHRHTDGYYYATGMHYENRSDSAGWVRSNDKINWSAWHENPNEYRFFEMDSDPQGNLWTASTSSGVDWGANNCNPAVFRNRDLVWRDTSRVNEGFWGIKYAFNDIFLGGSGRARVVRLSDKKTVLDLPDFQVIHSFVWDAKTNTLMALVNRDSDIYNSGARIYGTKNGDDWFQVGADLDCPMLFQGKQIADGTIHLVGGRWSQNNVTGYGRVYQGVR